VRQQLSSLPVPIIKKEKRREENKKHIQHAIKCQTSKKKNGKNAFDEKNASKKTEEKRTQVFRSDVHFTTTRALHPLSGTCFR
jgi:hypothetical protein